MSKIAFLGLGNMGLGMATNLAHAGHTVTGFDPAPAALDKSRERGILAASSALEAGRGADVIITMLPSGKHVLETYSVLVPAAERPTLFLDCSTIDVADARAAAEIATDAGHLAADAPYREGDHRAHTRTPLDKHLESGLRASMCRPRHQIPAPGQPTS
ncbi:NAD(P)-binding domain-containing protein [Rhodococcus koreensis]